MEPGGDLEKLFAKFDRGLKELESRIKASSAMFMSDQHLGNITTCPSNLGTGLRVSALIKLPHLGRVSRLLS
jgi:creatine kinase